MNCEPRYSPSDVAAILGPEQFGPFLFSTPRSERALTVAARSHGCSGLQMKKAPEILGALTGSLGPSLKPPRWHPRMVSCKTSFLFRWWNTG